MNRFSRFVRALSPACAVFVAGVAALSSPRAASAKTPSFDGAASSLRSLSSPRPDAAFVSVGIPEPAKSSTAAKPSGFSTLLSQVAPSPRGWKLMAAGDPIVLSFETVNSSVNESAGTFTIRVNRTGDTTVTTLVKYTTVAGTAIAGTPTVPGDFLASSSILTFGRGETFKNVIVAIVNDNVAEIDKSFTIALSEAASGPGTTTTTGPPTNVSIADDDSIVQFSVAQQSVSEGVGRAQLSVTRNGFGTAALTSATTVKFTTTDGTAIAGQNFVGATNQTLTFPATQLPIQQTITLPITIIPNNIDEPDKTFSVTLSAPGANTTVAGILTEIVTIIDDDDTSVAFALAVSSVNESAGSIVVRVTRSGDISRDLTVDYSSADGTANDGQDYTGVQSTLTFAANTRNRTISVPILNDNIAEDAETFTITLRNPQVTGVNATLVTPSTITITILDDESQVSFALDSSSVSESGGSALLTVLRTGGTVGTASADFTTSNGTGIGTATAGQDYTTTTGTVTFADGESSKTISIPILPDTLFEGRESFFVTLSNPVNTQLGVTSVTTISITDDDTAPSLTVADTSASEVVNGVAKFGEGNPGDVPPATAVFTVTLSAVAGVPVIVTYTTSDGTATVADKDYTATTGTLTIPAGSSSGTISVPVIGDTKFETNEAFILTLSNGFAPTASGGASLTLTQRKAAGQIINDDAPPTSTFNFVSNAVSVNEGVASGQVSLSVTRTGDTSVAASVQIVTTDGTAFAGDDFAPPTTRTLQFPATSDKSAQTQTFTIPIFDDQTDEPDETFSVALTNATSIGIANVGTNSTATVTILDDDDAPILTLSNARVVEGDSGTVNLIFAATLNTASGQTISVDFATADGTATVADNDYVAQAGTMTFAPGERSKQIVVVVNGDTQIETDETFKVNLSNALNVTLDAAATAGATGTIVNDDTAPTFSDITLDVSSVTVDENAGTATLTVSRTTGTDRAASIDFATADGTATAGSDYVATAGTLRFAVGQTSAQISVPIIDDTLQELGGAETFTVTLSNPGGNALAPTQATATVFINDNEGTPTLSIANTSVDEGDSGVTIMAFTVSLFPQSQNTVTVNVATTAGGTASSSGRGQDYRGRAAMLTFAPGVSTQTFAVEVAGDTIVEPDETILVQLSGAQNAPVSQAKATGTITNDDEPGGGGTIAFLTNSYAVNESAGTATITIGRSGKIDMLNQQSASVRVMTGSGSATPNADFRAVNILLTFAPGQTTKSIAIPIINDTLFEGDETVSMSLTDPSNNAILGSTTTATLSIIDDDPISNVPRADSLTPRDSVGSPFTTTATYSSDLGVSDLTQVLIQVGGNSTGGGFRALYNPRTNRLSLSSGTTLTATPRSRVVLSNTFGSLDCSRTTVERIGNTLRVTWTIRLTATTALPVYTGATGSSGESVFVRKGSWRPAVAADSSATGS